MNKTHLKIATRESQLALWQANFIKDRLHALHPQLQIELVGMTTKGDQILDKTLNKIGGKGLFVKELEQALLDGRADIAVHSMKDVPSTFPAGLTLPVICERADPHDAFVSNTFASMQELPEGAVLGTSSLRRQAQMQAMRPDIQIKPLRGNVNTRLRKLDDGEYDAICLAAIGLKRLGFDNRIRKTFSIAESLPAVGQGALGIECRANDEEVHGLIAPLNHTMTAQCVQAERRMNAILGGSCHIPVAGFATCENNIITLKGLVARPDASEILRHEAQMPASQALTLGENVAHALIAQGADRILAECR